MGDGERKFVLVMVAISIICLTVLYVFLFLSLWRYKELVGMSLLGIIVLAAWVWLRGRLNEQHLRQSRYHQHEETPLDMQGEPVYWPGGVQENPNHRASSYSGQSGSYQWSEGYRQEQ